MITRCYRRARVRVTPTMRHVTTTTMCLQFNVCFCIAKSKDRRTGRGVSTYRGWHRRHKMPTAYSLSKPILCTSLMSLFYCYWPILFRTYSFLVTKGSSVGLLSCTALPVSSVRQTLQDISGWIINLCIIIYNIEMIIKIIYVMAKGSNVLAIRFLLEVESTS